MGSQPPGQQIRPRSVWLWSIQFQTARTCDWGVRLFRQEYLNTCFHMNCGPVLQKVSRPRKTKPVHVSTLALPQAFRWGLLCSLRIDSSVRRVSLVRTETDIVNAHAGDEQRMHIQCESCARLDLAGTHCFWLPNPCWCRQTWCHMWV